MEIEDIKLRHFKCFENVAIKCSKFTLLAGANSSGKSSVLYGLLGALQTKDFPIYYSPNGSYVTMGDFRELAYEHSGERDVGIGLAIRAEESSLWNFDAKYSQNPDTGLPQLSGLECTAPGFSASIWKNGTFRARIEADPTSRPDFKIVSKVDVPRFIDSFFRSVEIAFEKTENKPKKRSKKKSPSNVPDSLEKFLSTDKAVREFAFENASEIKSKGGGTFSLDQGIREMTSLLEKVNERFNFISPFRVSPERTYYRKTKAALKVDQFGNNAIDQIMEWEYSHSEHLTALKLALNRLSLAADITTAQYGGGRFDIRVTPSGSRLPSSLCDVGFGVSQLLPVLVADLQLPAGSTLTVSQPEIHLHPSAQAELANYFCERSSSEKKRYILETHSEYMINRFRLLIAKGEVKEDEVSLYYICRENGNPVCHPVRFTKSGQIEGAPKEFFSTYMMDVMDIALNA